MPTATPSLIPSTHYRVAKRILDLLIAIPALVTLFPLMLAIAAIVKLTGKGHVLFCQDRVGLNNRTFKLYKFRTMKPDSEKAGLSTCPNDPRVTLAGRALRRPHLDELPQLWNVIKGEMSIVGPRPKSVKYCRAILAFLPNYESRTRVRPGITGLAQVATKNHDHTPEALAETLRADCYYVANLSLTQDIWIMIRTAKIMLLGKGV